MAIVTYSSKISKNVFINRFIFYSEFPGISSFKSKFNHLNYNEIMS